MDTDAERDPSADLLAETTSLCPECLERVPGRYESREETVYLTRTCPDHGTASRTVWGSRDHWEWARERDVEYDADGDLTVAGDHACLAIVEVTQDCNLSCSFCFAGSGPGGKQRAFEDVVALLEVVEEEAGPRPIQFSGGEPTVRDDLPELVEAAASRGFDHVQVNTNGIRIANEDGYAQRLADAGVTALYLQFDGLRPETYEEIREVDLTEEKHRAIEACREADLSVVLVPTIVPGVNDDELGDVVRFGIENSDVVESINFQPVAHFGRYGDENGRFPLDEVARRLAAQLEGLDARDVRPVPCCSSYCQMATALLPRDDGVVPLTQFLDDELLDSVAGMVDESDWMELLANTTAGQTTACSTADCCCGGDLGGTTDLLGSLAPEGAGGLLEDALPVSITGFMDADAADAERLENCCLSVPTPDGDLVPFCGYNMTTEDGDYAIRTREGWGGRPAVDEPVPDEPEPGGYSVEPARSPDTDGRVDGGGDAEPVDSSGDD
ncbi:MAG: putative radical SAM superfamily Fe-S cluster-containing enzyme [Haloarculaceae archaeon]|jgi:uncharacterized radical SAM superfamily Fe-S cluster-containing enzyme